MNRTAVISVILVGLVFATIAYTALADTGVTGDGDCTGNGPHAGQMKGHHYARGNAPMDGSGMQYHGQGPHNGTCDGTYSADCPYT